MYIYIYILLLLLLFWKLNCIVLFHINRYSFTKYVNIYNHIRATGSNTSKVAVVMLGIKYHHGFEILIYWISATDFVSHGDSTDTISKIFNAWCSHRQYFSAHGKYVLPMIMIMTTKTTPMLITAHKTTEGMMTLFSCQFFMVAWLVSTVGRLVTVGYRYKHGRPQYFHVTFGKFLRFLSMSKSWNLYRRDKTTCMEYEITKYLVWLNHYSSPIPYPSFLLL